MTVRILLIEDNRDLRDGIRTNLEFEGYEVCECGDGAEAMARIRADQPDLIVLDMMLPHRSGFEILAEVRAAGMTVPLLCLTARGEEVDKVRALRGGADDYLTKPFGLMEFLARVEVLLRRCQAVKPDAPLQFGDLCVLPARREVRRGSEVIELAPKEYALLLALAMAGGAVRSRQQLLSEVWGHGGVVVTRTVDTHIAELRRKLEVDPAHPRHILTVRKAGYRLQ